MSFTEEGVDIASGIGAAIVQDSYYSQQVAVVDSNGDPFDLTLWTLEAQARSDVYDEDSTSDLTFLCVVDDGPLGLATVKAQASQTALLGAAGGRWDLQMTNNGDTGFDPLYRSVLFRGVWKLIQDVTRV